MPSDRRSDKGFPDTQAAHSLCKESHALTGDRSRLVILRSSGKKGPRITILSTGKSTQFTVAFPSPKFDWTTKSLKYTSLMDCSNHEFRADSYFEDQE